MTPARLILCARCDRPLADHCKRHYEPCCPGHCTGTKRGHQSFTEPRQTGTFYCSGCGRKFRYTHEGHAVCLTHGCPFGEER